MLPTNLSTLAAAYSMFLRSGGPGLAGLSFLQVRTVLHPKGADGHSSITPGFLIHDFVDRPEIAAKWP